jgi:hypothetical protein
MPQPLDLDGKILVAIRYYLGSLPGLITHERSELVTKWEVLCNEKDVRHRQLLFAHLRDQQSDRHSDDDRSVTSELDRQIGELSDELHTLELLAPILSFEGDFTKAQQQHQAELNRLRNQRKRRVRIQLTIFSKPHATVNYGSVEHHSLGSVQSSCED